MSHLIARRHPVRESAFALMTVLLNSPSPIPSSFYRWRSTTHIDVSENVSWKLVGKQTKGTSARNFGEISVTFVCVLFLGGDERTVRAGNLITPVDFWSWDFCWFSEPQKMGTAMVGTKKKRRHTHKMGPKMICIHPSKLTWCTWKWPVWKENSSEPNLHFWFPC